jgi:serine/threonine protein kinase
VALHFEAKPLLEDFMHFSFADLNTGRYLGRGTFGIVQEVSVRLTPNASSTTKVAVKLFKGATHGSMQLPELLRQFRNEIVLAKRLESHPNIVKFVGACLEYPNLCLVLEYLAQGDLLGYMRDSRNRLSKELLWHFAFDLATAMAHIHRLGIVHRDCKSSNCLVASIDPRDAVTLKLGDFGLSRYVAKTTGGDQVLRATMHVGTVQWTAPEILCQKQPGSTASDVYSFGVILWEMLWRHGTGAYRMPFQASVAAAAVVSSSSSSSSFFRGSPPSLSSSPPAAATSFVSRPQDMDRLKKLKQSGDGLEMPSRMPSPAYAVLLRRCTIVDPKKRPTFSELEKTLAESDLT